MPAIRKPATAGPISRAVEVAVSNRALAAVTTPSSEPMVSVSSMRCADR